MRKTSVRNYVHLLIICIPLLLLLIACIFPNKKSENYYNGVETSTSETTSSVMFNQLIKNGNFENTDNWIFTNADSYSVEDNVLTLVVTRQYGSPLLQYVLDFEPYHYYYMSLDFKQDVQGGYTDVCLSQNASNRQSFFSIQTSSSDFIHYSKISQVNNTTINALLISNFSANITQTMYIKNIMLIDLTKMYGTGNEPNLNDFETQFPLEYYEYNQGELLMVHEVETTTTINETSNIVYTQDTKQINTNIIKPINDFYNLSINNWYREVLRFIGINYDNDNIVKTYIAYQPLWLMWFFLLEIVEIVLTAVPRLLILICKKIGGDEV